MSLSVTDIANMALGHIGVSKVIANILTSGEREAIVCRRYFVPAKECTLRDAAWPFATTRRELSLIEEDPNEEWAYSYQYPSDCLYFRRIQSGIRNETPQSRIPFKIEHGTTSGLIILTDQEDAIGEYTQRLEDISTFPADFSMALSFRLASYIATTLTAGDPFQIRAQCLQLYQMELASADASSFNEDQPDEPPQAEFIRDRE